MSKDNENKSLVKHSPQGYGSILNLTDQQLEVFKKLAEDGGTGVKTVGGAILLFSKARELGIGFGNAIPHMHVVNGRAGIDIHIIKAILSKPGTGIRWETIYEYEPIYQYFSSTGELFTTLTLPENYLEVPLKQVLAKKEIDGKYVVTKMVDNANKIKPPIDYISKYKFTRKKKDIDGTYYTVEEIGEFKWSDALRAQLPFDKHGNLSAESAWGKYPKIMLNTRAFTLGARAIASDLLMGNYETSELLDSQSIQYEVIEGNGEPEVTILDDGDNNNS